MTRTSGFTLGRRVGQSGHAPRPGYNAVHDDLPAPPHTFGRPAPGPAPGTAALSMDGAVSRGPCPAQRFRTSGPGGGALGGAPEPVASLARPPARHPVVVLSVIAGFAPAPGLTIAIASLEAAFYFYASGSMIAYMLEDPVATRDELFATGATFTLLAWGFAYAYVVCQAAFPGSFGAAGDVNAPRTWMDLLYLSVMVLSSVGLSDIFPVTPMARAIVMLEAMAGVMYIALVVSRLIGFTLLARKPM